MPLTAAEISKRYREKQKRINPQAYKDNECLRKAAYRTKMRAEPTKWAAYLAKDRMRKKKSANSNTDNCCTSTQQEGAAVLPSATPEFHTDAFTTKQSLGKSVKRANNALPSSTPKKVAVLATLVSKLKPEAKKKVFSSARRRLEDSRGRPPAFNEEQQK